jgi:hypothetical protein
MEREDLQGGDKSYESKLKAEERLRYYKSGSEGVSIGAEGEEDK